MRSDTLTSGRNETKKGVLDDIHLGLILIQVQISSVRLWKIRRIRKVFGLKGVELKIL